jgi:RNA polymerase sigma factor (sigma-70 family)
MRDDDQQPRERRPDDEPPAVPEFEEIFARWSDFARLARLMLGSDLFAEELTQEAFARALPRWHEIDHHEAYIRASLVRLCLNRMRRAGLERDRLPLPPDVLSPDDLALWDLVSRLPSRKRAAVVLRYYGDLTIDEIAEAMRTRRGTVASLLHRALADLRRELRRD